MFTGIVQGMGTVAAINDHDGLRTFEIEFPNGFCEGLEIGASVSIDGVCLTVTKIISPNRASFDVMMHSLNITTLGTYNAGHKVNIERAAKDGAEIGGHPLSGHIDCTAAIIKVQTFDANKVLRFQVRPEFMRYIFTKGYIAINGCSLTVSEASRSENCFEVWLIPETRRITNFEGKCEGDRVNIEIERGTQVVVDTIRDTVREYLVKMNPSLEKLLTDQGLDALLPQAVKLGKS